MTSRPNCNPSLVKLQVSVMFIHLSLDNGSLPFPVRASEELEQAEELEPVMR